MHLVVDSGSTKTLWCLVDKSELVQEVHTLGINPYISSKEFIASIVKDEVIGKLAHKPDAIFYYGAGCSSKENCSIINFALQQINPNAHIEVHHDLLAVARALCQNEKGIAVILGTGSNSCLYDGTSIIQNTPSLGYVIGDEGSGSYLGKKIVSDFWYGKLPSDLNQDFRNTYPFDLSYFLDKIYKEQKANAFLASFTKWLAKHRTHSYVNDLIKSSFSEFIDKQIAPYGKDQTRVIHCIGSIAFYFMDEWKEVILQKGYELGRIEQEPTKGLIQYHSQWKK